MKKKYVNLMSKVDEETAHRLERIRDKFGFSSCYEIMQCLISAFLRYADPGGEPYAELDQAAVHLSHIFEGLENDLTRAAVGKPGGRTSLRLDDIIAVYSMKGKRRRTVRHYEIRQDDSVTSSVNEDEALRRLLAAVSPRVARAVAMAQKESGNASLVAWLDELTRDGDAVGNEVRSEMRANADAQVPAYGERTRRTRNHSASDEADGRVQEANHE